MVNTSTIFIFLIFILLIKVFLSSSNNVDGVKKAKKAIPVPPTLPLLGNFVTMAKLDPVPYRAFHALSQQFGSILKLILGPTEIVVLSSYDIIKEAMNNEFLDNRAPFPTIDLIRFGKKTFEEISFFNQGLTPPGTKVSPTERWKELRRFTLKSLRDLGFGKSASEEAIIRECKMLVENIKNQVDGDESVVDLVSTLNYAALNIIWNLVAGRRYQYDDPEMKKRANLAHDFMSSAKYIQGKPLGSLPMLRFIPPFRSNFLFLSNAFKEFHKYIDEEIEDHMKTLDPNNPRDLIDMFLVQAGKDTLGIYTKSQLLHICTDMFIAGSETTSESLSYAIAILMRYPNVQEKAFQYIDKINSDVVKMKDKPNLPYVEATLNEVWRVCNIAPIGPPRLAHMNTTVDGFTIPAGANIMYNCYTLHYDEKHWGDPDSFRPERFIDSKGSFKNNHMLNPFGIGRRKCLGESLARMENFLFLANILKNFKLSSVGPTPPSLEPDVGFTNGPFPFKTRITIR